MWTEGCRPNSGVRTQTPANFVARLPCSHKKHETEIKQQENAGSSKWAWHPKTTPLPETHVSIPSHGQRVPNEKATTLSHAHFPRTRVAPLSRLVVIALAPPCLFGNGSGPRHLLPPFFTNALRLAVRPCFLSSHVFCFHVFQSWAKRACGRNSSYSPRKGEHREPKNNSCSIT